MMTDEDIVEDVAEFKTTMIEVLTRTPMARDMVAIHSDELRLAGWPKGLSDQVADLVVKAAIYSKAHTLAELRTRAHLFRKLSSSPLRKSFWFRALKRIIFTTLYAIGLERWVLGDTVDDHFNAAVQHSIETWLHHAPEPKHGYTIPMHPSAGVN